MTVQLIVTVGVNLILFLIFFSISYHATPFRIRRIINSQIGYLKKEVGDRMLNHVNNRLGAVKYASMQGSEKVVAGHVKLFNTQVKILEEMWARMKSDIYRQNASIDAILEIFSKGISLSDAARVTAIFRTHLEAAEQRSPRDDERYRDILKMTDEITAKIEHLKLMLEPDRDYEEETRDLYSGDLV